MSSCYGLSKKPLEVSRVSADSTRNGGHGMQLPPCEDVARHLYKGNSPRGPQKGSRQL